MNYEETLKALHSIPRQAKGHSLERMGTLLSLLGHPEKKGQFVHVAGTNGKGSVSKLLANALQKSGYRVGLFTSPYILDFRERIQINETLIAKEAVCRLYEEVMVKAALLPRALGLLTEFEVVTAMAFLYFAKSTVDVAVIEVGIGGLYDATNVLSPILSVVTPVSLDHKAQLGDTLSAIATHKAGIIKKGVPVVCAPQKDEALRILQDVAKEVDAPMVLCHKEDVVFTSFDGKKQRALFTLSHNEPWVVSLSLLGLHQLDNALTALQALQVLMERGYDKLSKTSIQEAFAETTWTGRMEILQDPPLCIVDGAHNEDGALRLVESMKFYYPKVPVYILLGMLKDKDVQAVLRPLKTLATKFYLHTPKDPRALAAEELRILLGSETSHECHQDLTKALEEALATLPEGGILLACGSLYSIGPLKEALAKIPHEKTIS